jgi:hypothetical protein
VALWKLPWQAPALKGVGGGPATTAPSYFLSRGLFLRLLALVYLAAFVSLGVQIDGLVGSRGILPVGEYLTAVRAHWGNACYYLAPTLCWLDPSDSCLHALCIAGVVLSGLLLVGVAPVPVLLALWACYLSLATAGQIFLNYQWDALLLETGFLAIFLAPGPLWPRPQRETPPSPAVLWLFRWLLFRLMFTSGLVKLLSGDPAWHSLTALHYHYETQPLPTWTSWYIHQMPGWFQQLSVLFLFAVELVLPPLLFGPRRGRLLAVAGFLALQLLILGTGNYGFFNLLTIALCLLVLDDTCFPTRLRGRFPFGTQANPTAMLPRWGNRLRTAAAAGLFLLSLLPFLANVRLLTGGPPWFLHTYQILAGFRSVNSYGLFAIMTTQRDEIVIEGSDDGVTWHAYEFRWKPGDVHRRPAFTTPHLPRLDWQMWFAALGAPEDSPWLLPFFLRLLEGRPEVLALLGDNPFRERPPRYVRAVLFQYRFTDLATRRATGAWWRREPQGTYVSPFSGFGWGKPGSGR